MMAAGTAAARGRKTLLLDKNREAGRKLRITGKGRCNVTNECSVQEAVGATPRGGKFLYGAFSAFPPEAVMAFFEELGVRLKTERGKRVFPVSDSAHEVADALFDFVRKNGADYRQAVVRSLLLEGDQIVGVQTQEGSYGCKSLVLACGGASYPGTGSDGGGYKLARQAGHTVRPAVPSLIPLVEQGSLCASMQGVSLRNCGLRVTEEGQKKPVYEDFGELLFTHFGLSGPVILSASAHMHPMASGKYTVHIDLKPALSEKQLDTRLLRDLEESKNKLFSHVMEGLLPRKMVEPVQRRLGVPVETRCHSLTREQRRTLCLLLKDFTLSIEGFRPIGEAIVTSGGVDLREVSPKTMESKRISGLYFAGELLDADAYTGGFNLQIAFSTGKAAGDAV